MGRRAFNLKQAATAYGWSLSHTHTHSVENTYTHACAHRLCASDSLYKQISTPSAGLELSSAPDEVVLFQKEDVESWLNHVLRGKQ